MCPAGKLMRVIMLTWPLMALEFQGVSSHVGSLSTTRNSVSVCSEEASACRTVLSMSSGSYSGMAIHEFIHR